MAKSTFKKLKRILCYVDLNKSSASLIEFTSQISANTGAELFFMHSVTDISKFAGFYVPHMNTSSLSEQMIGAAKDKLYAICTRTIGEVDASHRIIKEGDPLNAIYDVIDENKIDLLVIGHEFTTFSLFGGDYVQKFLKNPSCPVLVYPVTGE